jgi:hypothetical protein
MIQIEKQQTAVVDDLGAITVSSFWDVPSLEPTIGGIAEANC